MLDVGGSHDVSNACAGIIMQGVRDQGGLCAAWRSRVHQLHIIVEHCLACGWSVFSPVARELILLVEQASALEEVAHAIELVIVETIGVEGTLAVSQHHITAHPGYLVKAVIIEYLACERKGIALHHPYMAVGIKGVGGFEEQRTVAVHEHIIVPELHIAHQELRVRPYMVIEIQFIGMQQVHLTAGVLLAPAVGGSPFDGRHGSKQTYAKQCYQTYETYSTVHLTSPIQDTETRSRASQD